MQKGQTNQEKLKCSSIQCCCNALARALILIAGEVVDRDTNEILQNETFTERYTYSYNCIYAVMHLTSVSHCPRNTEIDSTSSKEYALRHVNLDFTHLILLHDLEILPRQINLMTLILRRKLFRQFFSFSEYSVYY